MAEEILHITVRETQMEQLLEPGRTVVRVQQQFPGPIRQAVLHPCKPTAVIAEFQMVSQCHATRQRM